MEDKILYKNNDNIIRVQGLRYEDGSFIISSQNVTFKLKTFDDEILIEKTMSYATNSNGDYYVEISADKIDQLEDFHYKMQIDVDTGSKKGSWISYVYLQNREI